MRPARAASTGCSGSRSTPCVSPYARVGVDATLFSLQSARGAAKLPLRQRLHLVDGHAEPLAGIRGPAWPAVSRSAISGSAGLCAIARWNSPSAAGWPATPAPTCAPADSPKTVTRSGSPPNDAMFSRDPAQSGELVPQRKVVVESIAEVAELEAAENADAVGDVDDHDVAVRRQPRPVVQLKLTRAVDERAAGNPHHHRQRGRRCPATTPSASDTPRREPSGRRGHRRRTTCSAEAAARARRRREAPTTAQAGPAPETVVRRRVARRTERRATPRRRPRWCRADPPIPVCTTAECPATDCHTPNRSVGS